MGARRVRPGASLVLAAFLALTASAGALSADDLVSAGLPTPPYVGPAFVVEISWPATGEQVFEYGVTTSSDAIGDPGGGDHNFVVGGCEYPIVPMLITKRTWQEADQAAGLGTWSAVTGQPWAGVHHNADTGGPLTYTILARSHSLCGGFEDVWDDAGCCVRKMPKSAKVTATVRYYPPGSATPDPPVAFTADVGLFNIWALDRAEYGGPAYERPGYVSLGTVILPPIVLPTSEDTKKPELLVFREDEYGNPMVPDRATVDGLLWAYIDPRAESHSIFFDGVLETRVWYQVHHEAFANADASGVLLYTQEGEPAGRLDFDLARRYLGWPEQQGNERRLPQPPEPSGPAEGGDDTLPLGPLLLADPQGPEDVPNLAENPVPDGSASSISDVLGPATELQEPSEWEATRQAARDFIMGIGQALGITTPGDPHEADGSD